MCRSKRRDAGQPADWPAAGLEPPCQEEVEEKQTDAWGHQTCSSRTLLVCSSAGIMSGPFCWGFFLHSLKNLSGSVTWLLLWVRLFQPDCGCPVPAALPWPWRRALNPSPSAAHTVPGCCTVPSPSGSPWCRGAGDPPDSSTARWRGGRWRRRAGNEGRSAQSRNAALLAQTANATMLLPPPSRPAPLPSRDVRCPPGDWFPCELPHGQASSSPPAATSHRVKHEAEPSGWQAAPSMRWRDLPAQPSPAPGDRPHLPGPSKRLLIDGLP